MTAASRSWIAKRYTPALSRPQSISETVSSPVPVVCTEADGELELVLACWSMPSPDFAPSDRTNNWPPSGGRSGQFGRDRGCNPAEDLSQGGNNLVLRHARWRDNIIERGIS